MDKLVEFRVDGDPGTKSRPRMTKTGKVYTPAGTRHYEGRVLRACMYALGKPKDFELVSGPIAIQVEMVCRRPYGSKGEGRGWCPYSRQRPDVDNCLKVVMDGLNKGLYNDDRQVCKAMVTKQYCAKGELPHILVKVWRLDAAG